MGTHGPIPKRSTERAGHRAKADRPDRVGAAAKVRQPPAKQGWHQAARSWYRSLGRSGQSAFYEPSDWEYARILADLLTVQFKAPKPSSEMIKAILGAMDNLGTTEGARRRMRIEVDRSIVPASGVEAAKVAVLDQYRDLG